MSYGTAIHCQGFRSSPIIELYYLESDPGDTLNSSSVDDGDAISLMACKKDMGIWDFESAIAEGLLKWEGSLVSDRSVSLESLWAHEMVPNIRLNLSR